MDDLMRTMELYNAGINSAYMKGMRHGTIAGVALAVGVSLGWKMVKSYKASKPVDGV